MVFKESQDESHRENENDEAQAGGPDQVEPPEIAEQPAAAVWKGFVIAVLCSGWFFLRYMQYMISVFVSIVLKHYKNTHPKEDNDNDDQTLPVNTLDFNSENEKGFIKNTGTNRGISQARNLESTVASGGPNIAHSQDQMEHDQKSEKMKPIRTVQDRGMMISNQSGEPECSRSSSDLDQSIKSLKTLDHEEPLMSLGGGQDYQKLEKMKPTRTTLDRGMMVLDQCCEPECSRSSSDLNHSVEELKTLDHEEPQMSLLGGQGLHDSSLISCQGKALSGDAFTQTSKEFDTTCITGSEGLKQEKDGMLLTEEEEQSDGALDGLVLGDRKEGNVSLTESILDSLTGEVMASCKAFTYEDMMAKATTLTEYDFQKKDATGSVDGTSVGSHSSTLKSFNAVEDSHEGKDVSVEVAGDRRDKKIDSCPDIRNCNPPAEVAGEDDWVMVEKEQLGESQKDGYKKDNSCPSGRENNDDPPDEEVDEFVVVEKPDGFAEYSEFGQDIQTSETGYFSEIGQAHQGEMAFSLKVPLPMKDGGDDSFIKEEHGMIGGKVKKRQPLDAGQSGAPPKTDFSHSFGDRVKNCNPPNELADEDDWLMVEKDQLGESQKDGYKKDSSCPSGQRKTDDPPDEEDGFMVVEKPDGFAEYCEFGQDSQTSETGYSSEISQAHQEYTEFSLKVPKKDGEDDSIKKEAHGMTGGKLKKQEPLDAGQSGALPKADFPHSPLGSEDDEQMQILHQQLKTFLQEIKMVRSQLQLVHRQLQMVLKKAQIPMQCSEHCAQSYWTQMAIQEAPQPFHEPSMHNTSQAIACQMPANVTIGNDKGELGQLHAHEELSCIPRECHAMNPKAEERDASKASLWKTEGGRLVTFCTEYL